MIHNQWPQRRLSDLIAIHKESLAREELAKLSEAILFSLPGFDSGRPETVSGSSIGSNKYRVPSDCVLFSRLNPRIPRVWRVKLKDDVNALCSTEFWPLTSANEGELDLGYLAWFLQSAAFLRHPSIQPAATTKSHQRVDLGSLKRFILPVPPLWEQRKISNILQSVAEMIEKTEVVIEHSRLFKEAMMQELLTRGIPSRHTHFKKTELLGELPRDWEVMRLRDTGRWLSGGTPSKAVAGHWSGPIPWVSPKDMKKPRLSDTIDHVSLLAAKNGTRLVPPGTILVVVRGMILAHSFPVALTLAPMCFNQDIKALLPSNRFEPEFILYWLIFSEAKILLSTSASTHGTQRIPTEALLSYGIPVPSLPEQSQIVNILRAIDELIDVTTREREALETMKEALLPRLLSGEIRVKPDETAS